MPQIIIKRSDGRVSLGPIADEADPAEVVAKWQAVHPDVTAVSWRTSQVSVVRPPDRWFRNAWTDDESGDQVDVNMPKAREIQADKIQAAREGEIARLQREKDRARLAGRTADADQHAANRAALETMNLTAVAASITGAANPIALKAIWPAGLPSQE